MMEKIFLQTEGSYHILDITFQLQEVVKKSGIKEGCCVVFALGSTCGLTTIEYEEGLLKDFRRFLKRWIPQRDDYEHCKKWGDCNAVSHLLSSLVKTFLVLPIKNNNLLLGTWQNVVFLDFDKKPREREIVVATFPFKDE